MAKIRLAPSALSDLEGIKQYISETLCNPIAAQRVVNKIINDYRLLENSPLMGASLSRVMPIETDYRYMVSGNYIIFYKTEGEFVSIYRVLYGKRDYIRILFGENTGGKN